MKFLNYLIVSIVILVLCLPAAAGQKKVIKDAKALLTSAKIAMRDSPPRYDEAMGYLDTILADHGPIPEAYFYRGNIYGEYASKEYNPGDKIAILEKMAANYDSMFSSCESDAVKSKYKGECKSFSAIADSIKIFYWKDSYNNGVNVLSRIDHDYSPQWKEATDPETKESAQAALQAAADTSRYYFLAATVVDPNEHRAYEGLGIVYDRLQNYDSSSIWFKKALEKAPDSAVISTIQNIAYAYIQAQKWDSAIVYFKRLLKDVPDDINTISNISICYTNKRMYDSSYAYNLKILEIDPNQAGANIDIGQYFLWRSQQGFSDSISLYQKENNQAKAGEFIKVRDALLDTAAMHFKAGIDLEPDNILALEQYSVIMLILGRYKDAEGGFEKLTALDPSRKENWVNLGDTYVQEQRFEDAIGPFEKALEIDPGDVRLLETLADLYDAAGSKEKAQEARDRIKEFNSP
jgi:tetratricopeptide (TPR) repeat protein